MEGSRVAVKGVDCTRAARCIRAWGCTDMTRCLSIVTFTSCCCPHQLAGWGHSNSSLLMAWLWWSSRDIDFSRWSGIAWRSMWHLCEQALQLIIFWLLPFIQSYLYITKKYWMKERVKCFGYDSLQVWSLMVVLTVFGWLLVQFLLPYLTSALTSELLQLLL